MSNTTGNSSKERKDTPVFSGVMMYFPRALAAVARLSKKGNDKHNPGQPLHWAREKSTDHPDCIARHLIDGGKEQTEVDEETGELHAVETAWRALANCEVALERLEAKPEVVVRWAGGKCPVPPGTLVRVQLRMDKMLSDYETPAGGLRWDHKGSPGDIVAYQVVK